MVWETSILPSIEKAYAYILQPVHQNIIFQNVCLTHVLVNVCFTKRPFYVCYLMNVKRAFMNVR